MAVAHHSRERSRETTGSDALGGAPATNAAPPVRLARRVALPVAGKRGARFRGSLVRTSPDAEPTPCSPRYSASNEPVKGFLKALKAKVARPGQKRHKALRFVIRKADATRRLTDPGSVTKRAC